jgi:hypothetical protein
LRAAGALYGLVVVVLAACGRPGVEDPGLDARRPAARRALEILAVDRPASARQLEAEIERAERLLGERAPAGSIDRAWARVATLAGRALHLRAREREQEARFRRLEAEARQALAQAEAALEGHGAGRADAAAIGRARVALEVGARLARDNELAAAAVSVGRVAELLEPTRRRARTVRDRYADPGLLRRWQGWVEATVAESRRSGRSALVVDKLGHRLLFLSRGQVVRELPADLGTNGLAEKLVEGDRATPEGLYRVVDRKDGSRTSYHRALLLDYPNEADRHRTLEAAAAGRVPEGSGPGGLIATHGGGGRARDWTDGCVALPDREMEWVFEHVPEGTPVTIVGTVRWP